MFIKLVSLFIQMNGVHACKNTVEKNVSQRKCNLVSVKFLAAFSAENLHL